MNPKIISIHSGSWSNLEANIFCHKHNISTQTNIANELCLNILKQNWNYNVTLFIKEFPTLRNIPRNKPCLLCICKVESSGCKEDIECGDGGASCGPYQIQYNYWDEDGRHGTDYLSCVKKFSCAEKTVRGIWYKWQFISNFSCSNTAKNCAFCCTSAMFDFSIRMNIMYKTTSKIDVVT